MIEPNKSIKIILTTLKPLPSGIPFFWICIPNNALCKCLDNAVPGAVLAELAKFLREFRMALICPVRRVHLTPNAYPYNCTDTELLND